MAKPPKIIKLINYDWVVNEVDQAVLDATVRNTHPCGSAIGNCIKNDQIILISKEQSKQELPRTVLHEVLHACLFRNKMLDYNREEEVVCLLEERLTDLIKNNPKLIKYLQENL